MAPLDRANPPSYSVLLPLACLTSHVACCWEGRDRMCGLSLCSCLSGETAHLILISFSARGVRAWLTAEWEGLCCSTPYLHASASVVHHCTAVVPNLTDTLLLLPSLRQLKAAWSASVFSPPRGRWESCGCLNLSVFISLASGQGGSRITSAVITKLVVRGSH